MSPGGPIVERKRKPDGSIREYHCRVAHATEGLLVVRFEMPDGGKQFAMPLQLPPGSWSFGYFWRRRPFNLYRMRGPDGAVLGHRFDAVRDVRFGAGEVSYRDLALDWWVLGDETLIEEDRDEYEQLVASGTFSESDVAAANEAARQVYSRYRHIIDDVAILERRLGLAE